MTINTKFYLNRTVLHESLVYTIIGIQATEELQKDFSIKSTVHYLIERDTKVGEVREKERMTVLEEELEWVYL